MIKPLCLKKPSRQCLCQRPPGKPYPQTWIRNVSLSAPLEGIAPINLIRKNILLAPLINHKKQPQKPPSQKPTLMDSP
jgi:hypothetical protein